MTIRSNPLLAAFGVLLLSVVQTVATAANHQARMKPGLLAAMQAHNDSQPFGAIVHFQANAIDARNAVLEAHGLRLARDWTKYTDAVFATGPVAAFESIATDPRVYYIEENRKLEFFDNSHAWATNLGIVREQVADGPFTVNGEPIDGRGSTIAILDSGVNGKHQDFAGRIIANYHVFCATPGLVNPPTGKCFANGVAQDVVPNDVVVVPIPNDQNSDLTGGHGTHVAGIAAGDSSMSDGGRTGAAPALSGTYTGVATGASIIGYGAGEALLITTAAEAFIHMLDNIGDFPIDVVNNSWGDPGGTAYDSADAVAQLIHRLVTEHEVVMTFASGNDGTNNPAEDQTSSYCKHPTPGVICVGNYDDGETGTQSGALNGSSGHGERGQNATYPDVAAPGTNITAACIQPEPGQAVCATGAETNWQPWYGTISGTSMAAPHVAGAVALIRQVAPDMSAADVEDLIKRTARQVEGYGPYEPDETQSEGGEHNWAFGAGLIDIAAALRTFDTVETAQPLPAGSEVALIENDSDDGSGSDVVAVTATNTTVDGQTGVLYKLTVADAALTDGVIYSLRYIIDGALYQTDVTVENGTAVAGAASPDHNAAPTSVSLSGTVISAFVPNATSAAAAVGTPVHNLRVLVFNSESEVVDYAPSPQALFGGVPASAVTDPVTPMFGVPFSIQLPSTAALQLVEGEGVLVQSFSGTSGIFVGVICFGCPSGGTDPDTGQGITGAHRYHFKLPTIPGGFSELRVVAEWDRPSDYLDLEVYGPAGTPLGISDDLDTNMQQVVLTDPVPGDYYAELEEFFVNAGAPFKVYVYATPNTFGGEVDPAIFKTGGPDFESNAVPVATDVSASTTEDVSVEITLTATDDDENDSLTYSIVEGPTKGTLGTVTGNKVTYTPNAEYVGSDSFTFKANDGTVDSNTASVNITVSEDPDRDSDGVLNGADNCPDTANADQADMDNDGTGDVCDADRDGDDLLNDDDPCPNDSSNSCVVERQIEAGLTATPTSGTYPLVVEFDATSSAYTDGTDIDGVSYTFVFGDGSEAVINEVGTTSHTYDAAGTYKAYVIVTDENGEFGQSDVVTIRATVSIGVGDPQPTTAALKVSATSGTAPLQVTFDGSDSVAAQNTSIVEWVFDFGDGNSRTVTDAEAAAAVTYTYTVPGTYTPKLTVEDSDGGTDTTSVTEVKVADVNGNVPPATTPRSSGGGSLGWLVLLPLMGAAIRRRRLH